MLKSVDHPELQMALMMENLPRHGYEGHGSHRLTDLQSHPHAAQESKLASYLLLPHGKIIETIKFNLIQFKFISS